MVENEEMEIENQVTRAAVLALITRKENLEKEISQLKEILDLNSVGMNESLVDTEGYPREDIDVFQVRHARHRIICLQNDHKALMREIEMGLHAVHSSGGSDAGADDMDVGLSARSLRELSPIARVNLVHGDSPAALSGLEVGDLILKFGTVSDENFTSLRDIGTVVEHSVGRKVPLTVMRGAATVRLSLTPKLWSGKGLLGCNILPVESVDR